MGSFVTVEAHEEVEHKRHSCKLSTEQILVSNRADINRNLQSNYYQDENVQFLDF